MLDDLDHRPPAPTLPARPSTSRPVQGLPTRLIRPWEPLYEAVGTGMWTHTVGGVSDPVAHGGPPDARDRLRRDPPCGDGRAADRRAGVLQGRDVARSEAAPAFHRQGGHVRPRLLRRLPARSVPAGSPAALPDRSGSLPAAGPRQPAAVPERERPAGGQGPRGAPGRHGAGRRAPRRPAGADRRACPRRGARAATRCTRRFARRVRRPAVDDAAA